MLLQVQNSPRAPMLDLMMWQGLSPFLLMTGLPDQ